MEKLLTIEEVADLLKKPVVTLYDWRHKGKGPKAIMLGKTLRYRPSDVESWLEGLCESQARPA